MKNKIIILLLFLYFAFYLSANAEDKVLNSIKKSVESGKFAFSLTEPGEIIEICGNPVSKMEKKDGGMTILFLKYDNYQVIFGKRRKDTNRPFTLFAINYKGERMDIGRGKKIVLRNESDLQKIDTFNGFQNISLRKLNLRGSKRLLTETLFDTLTEWPSAEKLPDGFNPDYLLENGKKRGLGINFLHKQKLDGRGVGIAIIDQPLLLGHKEYTSSIIRYDKTGMMDFPPQMHGSPVASIAVGKNIGVAPGASLTYFAVPMWERDNIHFIKGIRKVIKLNKTIPGKEKIRVICISTGVFSENKNYEEFKTVLVEAEKNGILVITCSYDGLLKFGTVERLRDKDPDKPDNYRPGKYSHPKDNLRIPTGNMTFASYRGNDVYIYDIHGGRSWAAPYLAGLAAIAFQIKPDLKPQKVILYLLQSAYKTVSGPIVNPLGFIKLVKGVDNHN